MRIAIDSRMLGREMTGIGRYTQNLIQYLLEADVVNQYILILNRDIPQLHLKERDNLKIVKINHAPLSLYTLFQLHRIVKKERIDLFHSPFFLAPLWATCPLIITVHDLMGLKFPGFFEDKSPVAKLLSRWFVKLFVPLVLKKSNKVIAVSKTTKEEIVKHLNISGDKIKVIYPSIESSFRKDLNSQLTEKKRKDLKISERIILYIGNTRPYKNLPRLIKAFDMFQKEYGDYQLVIGTGDTRNLESLKGMVRQLELEKKIIFTGALQDEDIILLMNSAELFVFPSLWEGFGLPPLEAMACGLPVVASNAGSLPEILGDAALLVNPESQEEIAEGIKQVLTDKDLREELIKKGFARTRLFSWEKTARETLEIYKSVEGAKK